MVVTAAKVGVVSTASVFISLVTDIISLISDVIFPMAKSIPSASDVIVPVVNFISSESEIISPVMALKMISGLETVISRLDIIVADTEITISCLAIILKGLSPELADGRRGHQQKLSPAGAGIVCRVAPRGESDLFY